MVDTWSLEQKPITDLDSILKQETSLPTKVCIVKTLVLPVVMYGCESWTIKKAESWRIDAFKLWCWRRLLRVPWTTRRSNLLILREINLEYSLEGLQLKLKLQNFGHLMQRANSLEKTLMLGKTQGRRRRRGQRMRWLDGIIGSIDISLSKLWGCIRTGKPGGLQSMGSQSQTPPTDWRTTVKAGKMLKKTSEVYGNNRCVFATTRTLRKNPTLHPARAESYTFFQQTWPYRQRYHCDEVLVEFARTPPSWTCRKSVLYGIEESCAQNDVSWVHSVMWLFVRELWGNSLGAEYMARCTWQELGAREVARAL